MDTYMFRQEAFQVSFEGQVRLLGSTIQNVAIDNGSTFNLVSLYLVQNLIRIPISLSNVHIHKDGRWLTLVGELHDVLIEIGGSTCYLDFVVLNSWDMDSSSIILNTRGIR